MHQAAAGHDTLVFLIAVVVCGAVLILPAVVLLFRLTLAGRFRDDAREAAPHDATPHGRLTVRTLTRCAVALVVAGSVLLDGADVGWAHAVGVVCLAAFIVVGFVAIAVPALDEQIARP